MKRKNIRKNIEGGGNRARESRYICKDLLATLNFSKMILSFSLSPLSFFFLTCVSILIIPFERSYRMLGTNGGGRGELFIPFFSKGK